MIEYTMAWLESAGMEEVFVFCCAHSKQVINYLVNSQWLKHPNMTVTTIESHNSISDGDALRLIYEKNVIHGDFVLITGDTVSNMSLTEVLQKHKERRKKDSAVKTMVIKKSKPSPITHQSRLGNNDLFMTIDPDTNELLYYEDKTTSVRATLTLDKSLLIDGSLVSLHNDMQAQFSQLRPMAMPHSVAPRLPMYPPGAPGLGQQIFYGQPPHMIHPQAGFGYQQQLVPGVR